MVHNDAYVTLHYHCDDIFGCALIAGTGARPRMLVRLTVSCPGNAKKSLLVPGHEDF